MPSPFEVVLEFFACFDRGDLARAGQLVADDAVITLFVSGDDPVKLRGFENFVSWYSRRRELLGDSFSYRVDELLPGNRHAVALIALSRGSRRAADELAAGRRLHRRRGLYHGAPRL